MTGDPKALRRPNIFWWIRQIFLMFLGCFFLIFGILILVSSYHLKEPHQFIMTFFASNFIILISAALILIFAFRMKPYILTPIKSDPERDPLDTD